MSEPQVFTSFQDWVNAARARGLDGPHKISDQPMQQFVRKTGGTAALWNETSETGFLFST